MKNTELRVTGILLLLAGLLPVAGVVNPDTWPAFSGTDAQELKAIADHPLSTQVSSLLVGAGFAVAIAAVASLARVLDTAIARLAVPVFAVGAGLTLADVAFGLKVSYDLGVASAGRSVPAWYGPLSDWGNALFTTGTGVLAALALLACGWEVIRSRRIARWAGWVAVIAAFAMLGQVAAFGGLIPFPLFLSFIVLGAAALARSRQDARAGHDRGSPALVG